MLKAEAFGQRGAHWSIEIPETRPERVHGLLGRDRLDPGTGMLFERASSLHTIGMRFPIVVAYLGRPDREGLRRVLRVATLRPGRLAMPRPRVRAVLELPVGTDVRVGDAILCRLSTAGSSARAPIV